MARKRPCSICRKWFFRDPRVRDRQRACSTPACQSARRRRTQAAWRAANPDYFIARRLSERSRRATGPPPERLEPLRLPAPLCRLPWDVAQDEFGVQRADFLGVLGKVLLGVAKDARRAQVAGSP
jgi:hypothetical protein